MLWLRRLSLVLLLLLLILGAGLGGWYVYSVYINPAVLENPFDPLIVANAKEAGLDPYLVRALIWRETKFNPNVPLGRAQERGLMQVTPAVGRAWAKAHKNPMFQEEDLQDPPINLQVGCWYLKQAIMRWRMVDDPVPFALAEYNAGRTKALEWVDPASPGSHVAFEARITYPTTKSYVEEIMNKRDEFARIMKNAPSYTVKPDIAPPQPIPLPASAPSVTPPNEPASPSH